MYIIVITHTYLYDWERDRQRSRSITLTPFHNKISTAGWNDAPANYRTES